MNKKWIALLLMLAMVLVGAVGLAAEATCPSSQDGTGNHNWERSTFVVGQESTCSWCNQTCGVIHGPDTIDVNGACPGCGQSCDYFGTVSHYYATNGVYDGKCQMCGYEHTNHTWRDTSDVENNCTECFFYCTSNGGHILITDASGVSTCSKCGFTCNHYNEDYGYSEYEQENSEDSFKTCSYCGNICGTDSHDFELIVGEYSDYYECKYCEYACPHSNIVNGECDICGNPCIHSWYDGYCFNCETTCDHKDLNDDNVCTTCGQEFTSNAYCTITFAPGEGGTGSMTAPTNVRVGGSYTLPDNGFTAKDGYTFKGWDVSCETYTQYYPYSNPNDVATLSKENVTITALWNYHEEEPVKYTLDIDFNGGSHEQYSSPAKFGEFEEGGITLLPRPDELEVTPPSDQVFDHYEINGKEVAAYEEFTISGNTTAKIIWKAADAEPDTETYTVTFMPNGASGSAYTQTYTKGKKQELTPVAFAVPQGYKEFAFWHESPDGTEYDGEWYIDEDYVEFDKKTTLYAIWAYELTVDYDGATDADNETGFNYDAVLKEMYLPTAEELGLVHPAGYTLKEWSVNDVAYQPGQTAQLNGKTTIKAVWNKSAAVTKYTVTFDANGGTGEMSVEPMEEGKYTLPACTFTGPTATPNFDCWLVNGVEKMPGDQIDVTDNVTVKAKWAKDVYTETFTAGDAADVDGNTSITIPSRFGEQFKVPVCEFIPVDGYEFSHWEMQLEGGTKAYNPGETIDRLYVDATFVAIWKQLPIQAKTEELNEKVVEDLPDETVEKLEEAGIVDESGEVTVGAIENALIEKAISAGFGTILQPENSSSSGSSAGTGSEAEPSVEVKIEVMEITPVFVDDDGYEIPVTPENFPEDGLKVRLDVPKGADLMKHDVIVLHLVTTEVPGSGLSIGQIEVLHPDPNEMVKGNLEVEFKSLSPVAIVWKDKQAEVIPDVDLPQTGDPSSLMAWVTLLGASGLGIKAIKRRKK